MTYECFLNLLEEKLQTQFASDVTLRRVRVLKNNGIYLDGFSGAFPGRRELPTIYVNSFYQETLCTEEIDKIAKDVAEALRNSKTLSVKTVDDLLSFAHVKDRIYCRLVCAKKNEALLLQLPHLRWLDLAIVFYIQLEVDELSGASTLIRHEYLEHWGISEETLCQVAATNTAAMPVLLCPLEELLEQVAPSKGGAAMYLLSNEEKQFGAAVIIDPKVQRMCSQRLGGDYYVLPSSIHELILLPALHVPSKEQMNATIQAINESYVRPEEILSDHAYYYSAKRERLEEF